MEVEATTIELAMGELGMGKEAEMAGPKLAAEETAGPKLAAAETAATEGLEIAVGAGIVEAAKCWRQGRKEEGALVVEACLCPYWNHPIHHQEYRFRQSRCKHPIHYRHYCISAAWIPMSPTLRQRHCD
jgi:hypothetical protein